MLRNLLQCLLGEFAVGCNFPAKYVQHWRPGSFIQLQHVVPRCGRSGAGRVIVERSHAGVGRHDVLSGDGCFEIFGGKLQQVILLLGPADLFFNEILVVYIRCANQGQISFIGNCKNDPTILPLEKIALVVIWQS
jgi:hypothetical protein